MTTENKFKLTFNKPTVDSFMRGDDFDGLRVKINDGGVEFLPVSVGEATMSDDYPEDVIPISTRERGGAEMIVEGSEASNLLRLLNDMNPGGRFFTVERGSGGWLHLEPFVETDERPSPGRTSRTMRVWSNIDPTNQPVACDLSTSVSKPVGELTVADFLSLSEQVSAYESLRRPGRPPSHILECKARIGEYVDAVMPLISAARTDLALVEQVHGMLGQAHLMLEKMLGKEEVAPAKPTKEQPKAAVQQRAPVETIQPTSEAPKAEPKERRPSIEDEARSWQASRRTPVAKPVAASEPERLRPSTVDQRLGGGRTRTVRVERLGSQRRRIGQGVPA